MADVFQGNPLYFDGLSIIIKFLAFQTVHSLKLYFLKIAIIDPIGNVSVLFVSEFLTSKLVITYYSTSIAMYRCTIQLITG